MDSCNDSYFSILHTFQNVPYTCNASNFVSDCLGFEQQNETLTKGWSFCVRFESKPMCQEVGVWFAYIASRIMYEAICV